MADADGKIGGVPEENLKVVWDKLGIGKVFPWENQDDEEKAEFRESLRPPPPKEPDAP